MNRRKLRITVLIIVFYCFLKKLFPLRLRLTEEEFTNVGLCPACYGQNFCPHFFHGNVQLLGASQLRAFHLINRKNVYYGRMAEKVVLKKLAHDWELEEGDQIICSRASQETGCDVKSAILSLLTGIHYSSFSSCLPTLIRNLNASTDIAKCPSERLLQYIVSRIIGDRFNHKENVESDIYSLAEIVYSIFINPEPLFLKAFPQSDGWPFPQYKGACGRVVVEEYVGSTLAEYEYAPWEERLSLSYQLLQIAHLLTENYLDFAMYMTDVNIHNFAVKSDGTVLLVDVENIIVVDRKKIRTERLPGWDQPYLNSGEACHDCLSFSIEDLCSHDQSDHNYYAICKGILTPESYYSTKGLLHDIPSDVDNKTNLLRLLKECAEPLTENRFEVVPKLLQTMKTLL